MKEQRDNSEREEEGGGEGRAVEKCYFLPSFVVVKGRERAALRSNVETFFIFFFFLLSCQGRMGLIGTP